ncbi:beta-1,3-galactosyltransferase 5-like [Ylistrum balloti]|uniref:beta-1,3-galactosyltransferase 5-like n=1 Tax=Ylistrum balloti TaxID=509963 RepID=UPI002905B6E9|nr:beta-1,3-galactosyltransferase 5-like [Ylistrum balloti]
MADIKAIVKSGGMVIFSQIQRKARPRQLFVLICILSFMLFFIHILNRSARGNTKVMCSIVEALRHRPEKCYNCNRHDFPLLINSDKVCALKSGSPVIHVLVLITSIHRNRAKRDMYRKTWLTHSKNNTSEFRYAFIFGNINDTEANAALLEESKIYNDIIQEDFQESYVNLTLKTIMAFKWASTHCPHAQFFMKTDDDMYVNIPGVRKALNDNSEQLKTAIGGKCMQIERPVRDKSSKWCVTYEYYGREYYPGYCAGTGYVTSMNMVKEVFKVSKHIPFFFLEDVFVSLCVERIGKSLHLIEGFNSGMVSPINSKLFKSLNFRTAHRVSPDLLFKLWNDQCVGEKIHPYLELNTETMWTDC